MAQQGGEGGVERERHVHGGRDSRAREIGQQLGEVDLRGRPLGQAPELGKLARQLLEPARFRDQHLDGLALRWRGGPGELRHGEADRRERVPHLVRHPPRRLPKGAEPLGLDLARAALLERSGHLAECRAQVLELGRPAPRPVGRQGLHPADVGRPADQLFDRPAELAREVAAHPHRGVQERRPYQQHDQAQAGIVIAAEGVDPLEPPDGAVELVGVIGEGSPLERRQLGGVETLDEHPPGGPDGLHRPERPRGGRRRAHGERPAEDRHGGRKRAETDQDEEDSMSEGEAHRSSR